MHGPLGIFGELATVPHAYDPYRPRSDAIEEPIRLHQHLAVRKVRELRERMTGLGKVTQLPERRLCAFQNRLGGCGTLSTDARERVKKLRTRRGCE
jgi:hypothetical protein